MRADIKVALHVWNNEVEYIKKVANHRCAKSSRIETLEDLWS
jgi:hypothetical protein